MKFLKVLCVVALVFAVSAIAYAETQSVKVSGDITMRAFARNDFDLDTDDAEGSTVSNDWATYLLSTAEVQIDADLTDNVSGVIRLVNQRVWGDKNYVSDLSGQGELIQGIDYSTGNTYRSRNVYGSLDLQLTDTEGTIYDLNSEANAFKLDIDLAYIELKEFLYSPLTLRIGRQDLWFGKGFIIGANLQDPQNTIYPMEYTAIQSFDAVRATLDYDPWTIDAVFAKISEHARRADDDVNLWGVNVGYVFDEYNAEAEGYWWAKQERVVGASPTFRQPVSTNDHCDNSINLFGARGSMDPIEDWTIALEGAYQFGKYLGINAQQSERDRTAWALDAMIECRYWQEQFDWKPVLGVEYIFYSGEKDMGDIVASTIGDYEGWDPMFRGKFDTAIREFQNVYYRTAMGSCSANTNQHQLLVRGCVEPTDEIKCDVTYGNFWLAEDYSSSNGDKYVGSELDLNVNWDYTEDVSFGLLSAWFLPGNHFEDARDDIATDIVGTVKLSF